MTGQKRQQLFVAFTLLASPCAFATNGMFLEGMGPESTGMGGAAQAVDNGTAAMVNNPATLGLMASGSGRSHSQTNLQLMYSRVF